MEAVKKTSFGLWCFLALNVVDCVMTCWLVSNGGVEGNWYRIVFSAMPIWAGILLKMGIVGVIAYWVFRYRRGLFKLLNVGMGIIVMLNMISISSYLVGRYG